MVQLLCCDDGRPDLTAIIVDPFALHLGVDPAVRERFDEHGLGHERQFVEREP